MSEKWPVINFAPLILFPYLYFIRRVKIFSTLSSESNSEEDEDADTLFNKPFQFTHKPRGWLINIGYDGQSFRGNYILEINGVKYSEMEKAPPRERAALARSAI